ncbi:unnamed protein product [Meganyctiphanes norvegica]|uniref:Uncharacterized protein n=1 Tax=Meganyctiphanes norvegica TaxID=48144 RepID=A0AAV2R4C0_MEGNR
MFTQQLISLALLGVASAGWSIAPTTTIWDYATVTVPGPVITNTHTLDMGSTSNVVVTNLKTDTVTFVSTSTIFETTRLPIKTFTPEFLTETTLSVSITTLNENTQSKVTCTLTATEFATTVMGMDIPVTLTHVKTVTKFVEEPIFRTKTIYQIETAVSSRSSQIVVTSYTQEPRIIIPEAGY